MHFMFWLQVENRHPIKYTLLFEKEISMILRLVVLSNSHHIPVYQFSYHISYNMHLTILQLLCFCTFKFRVFQNTNS